MVGATSNLGNSGILAASATSATITGLPVDGSSATVYLYALLNGVWTQLDSETVTTFTAPASSPTRDYVSVNGRHLNG